MKKTKSIDDIIQECAPAKADEIPETKTRKDKTLEKLMKKYEQMLEIQFQEGDEAIKYLDTIKRILAPEQINRLLQSTITHEPHKNYSSYIGAFISRLIQNSYDAGHNKFTLNTENIKEKSGLGYRLEGKPDDKIKIRIQGDAGTYCGEQSTNCTYNITGNTRFDCGVLSQNCEYNIQGNTGRDCGWNSTNCKYSIKGNAGESCGTGSTNCEYNIKGSIGADCGRSTYHDAYLNALGATHSTFKTNNEQTLKRMLQDVPEKDFCDQPSHNRIIFIKPDGTEEIVKDYTSDV